MKLTPRQARERQFFDLQAKQLDEYPISFESIDPAKDRPWNSYWCIDKLALRHFADKGETILDLGCGWGENSLKLARIGYHVFGVDISLHAIQLANDIAREHQLEKQIHLSVGVAESLNFPDSFFDYVYGVNILHHVEIEPTIKEVWRVLKPGGRAFFREHLRVPVLDALRETKLIQCFFPKEVSHQKGITHDERKITIEEIQIINSMFKNATIIKFELLSRFYAFFNYNLKVAGQLEKIDWRLLQWFPGLGVLGGSGVFMLQK